MNTLEQFKRIFTDFEFFLSDVSPCLSILAITDGGKSAEDLQKLLPHLLAKPVQIDKSCALISQVSECKNGVFSLNPELKTWLCNPDDAEEFSVNPVVVKAYADHLWQCYLKEPAGEEAQSIRQDLPHLLAVTDAWQVADGIEQSFMNYAAFLIEHKAYASAVMVCESLLDKSQHNGLEQPILVQKTVFMLGSAFRLMGDKQQALTTYQYYLDICQDEAAQHPAALLGAHHEAEDLHHKALNIRIKTYGEDHRHTAHSFHELGIVKHLKGDVTHAMELLKKALHLRRLHYGDDHSHTQDSHLYHALHFGTVPAHVGSDVSLMGRLHQVSRQAIQGIKSLFH